MSTKITIIVRLMQASSYLVFCSLLKKLRKEESGVFAGDFPIKFLRSRSQDRLAVVGCDQAHRGGAGVSLLGAP